MASYFGQNANETIQEMKIRHWKLNDEFVELLSFVDLLTESCYNLEEAIKIFGKESDKMLETAKTIFLKVYNAGNKFKAAEENVKIFMRNIRESVLFLSANDLSLSELMQFFKDSMSISDTVYRGSMRHKTEMKEAKNLKAKRSIFPLSSARMRMWTGSLTKKLGKN